MNSDPELRLPARSCLRPRFSRTTMRAGWKPALRHRAALLSASTALLIAAGAHAVILPQGPVVAGASGGPGATFTYGGASLLTINQSAQRVVIDWNSFSIGAGGTVNFNQPSSTSIAFNRVNIIPATGLSPLSTISGILNAQGGVWLFSTGGILLGSGAVIDVGSFAGVTGPLGAAGGLAQLLNPGPGGITSVGIDAPIGPGVESIAVQIGARITANSGFVVLQAETMAQNGAVTAFDGVEYAIAETGRIVFTTNGGGQQLQSAVAGLIAGQDRPSFSHGGATKAAWVGIDTPGGALQSGYHGLVNLDGEIQATGVKPGGGDGVVMLIGGDAGPNYPGHTNSSIGLDASGGAINATGGMSITTDSVRLGAVSLGRALTLGTYGDITLTAPVSVGGAAFLDSQAGALALDASLTAAKSVTALGRTIAIGPAVTIRSDALGAGAGGVILGSAGNITADPTSLVLAGPDPAAPTGPVTVRAGSGTGGGNIALGRVSASRVFVQSQSRGLATEGGITLAGDVLGTQAVTVLINSVASASAPAGELQVLGGVASAGLVDLEDLGPGAFVAGPAANVASSGGQVFLYAGGNTTIDGGARITGVSLLDHTLGALTIAPGASLTTTGASPSLAAAVIPSGSDFSRGSGLNLAASAMDIKGSVRAGATTAPGDIYIEVLGAQGATAVIGGAGGGAGFDLSNASFANLGGRNIIVMGGPGEARGPGASLQVADLTLDSAKLSSLWLGTASSQSITVAGAVTPAGPGRVDLQVGFVRLGQSGLDGFVPGEIDVTGSLGAATSPLGGVTLIARNDIFMGVPAFVTAARSDAAFNAVTQSANFPGFAPGHVLVAANTLQMAAQGRIIEQNTPGSGFPFAGLDIGAPTATTPLVFVPAAMQGQSIGGAWTADYALGPAAISLFGALAVAGGPIVADAGAATQPFLLDPQIAARASYLINSCVFGSSCAPATLSLTFQPPVLIDVSTGTSTADAGAQAVTGGAGATPDVISTLTSTAISLQQDDERLGSSNPITETGNGDLWSGPTNDCPPKPEPGRDCTRP